MQRDGTSLLYVTQFKRFSFRTLPRAFKGLEWERFFIKGATMYEYLSYNMSSINDNNFLTLWTVGIKLEYCFPSWNTREHRVSMAVLRNSGHVSRVLIMGWIIRDAKSVRSSDSLRRSRVSKAHLKLQQGAAILTTYCVTKITTDWYGGIWPTRSRTDIKFVISGCL